MLLFARESHLYHQPLTGEHVSDTLPFNFIFHTMFVTRRSLRYYFFEQGKLLRVVGFQYEIFMLCWLLAPATPILSSPYKCLLFPPATHIFIITISVFPLVYKRTCFAQMTHDMFVFRPRFVTISEFLLCVKRNCLRGWLIEGRILIITISLFLLGVKANLSCIDGLQNEEYS